MCQRSLVLVPLRPGDPGVEQRVVDQVEVVGQSLEVEADLLAEGVTVRGHIAELFEHGQVDVGLDVAHHAGVAVPVPGAPDATGLVDDADLLDTGLAQVGPDGHAGDTAADDDHIDLLAHRRPVDDGRERVVAIAGEVLVVAEVPDVGPAGHQPAVALGQVLGPHGLGVVAAGRLTASVSWNGVGGPVGAPAPSLCHETPVP